MTQEQILNHGYSLMDADPLLTTHRQDVLIGLLLNTVAFGVATASQENKIDILQLNNPQTETELLNQLMNKIGFFRIKMPLIVNADITTNANVTLLKNTRFTDNTHIYTSVVENSFVSGVSNTVQLQRCEINTKEIIINENMPFFSIPLGVTYKELTGNIEVVIDDTVSLEYSQNFIKSSGGDNFYTLSIDGAGLFSVVFGSTLLKIGKQYATGVKVNITYYTSIDDTDFPNEIEAIEVEEIETIGNINQYKASSNFMTVEEMRHTIRTARGGFTDLLTNNDFYRYITSKVPDLLFINVWHENEENETGWNVDNINKTFISYVMAGGIINNGAKNTEISEAYSKCGTNRNLVIKTTSIIQIKVIISIEKVDGKSIFLENISSIKSTLEGYYDQNKKTISKNMIYGVLNNIFYDRNLDYNVSITKLLTGFNIEKKILKSNFYQLLNANIIINEIVV